MNEYSRRSPLGADALRAFSQRGNPLGGLVYTNGFPSNNGNNNSYQQVVEWHKCVLFLTVVALIRVLISELLE